jgi:AbiTii
MNQIDEVIAPAADDEQPVSNVLRKCLILAFELKNEKLKTWVEKELNGFESKDDVPEYRKISLHSKGNFQGPGGAWIPSRPLPMGILSKKHRDFLVPTLLTQPIAAYEVDPE